MFGYEKLYLEVGLFVATTIASRSMSRDLFEKRYQVKQQEITAQSEDRKRARKTLYARSTAILLQPDRRKQPGSFSWGL